MEPREAAHDLREKGFAGPIGLLNKEQVAQVLSEWQRLCRNYPILVPGVFDSYTADKYWSEVGVAQPWFKSMHALSALIREVALAPQLTGVAHELFGEAVVLWGSEFLIKQSGQSHRWHADVEAQHWECLNFWLALENVSLNSTLKVITGSSAFPQTPQELRLSKDLDLLDEQAVLAAAKEIKPASELFSFDLQAGDGYLFFGKTWHGSTNTTERPRIALLFQYSPRTASIRIPMTYNPPIAWHPAVPPVVAIP